MNSSNMAVMTNKRKRLKINNLDAFKDALKDEGHLFNEFNQGEFNEKIKSIFQLDIRDLEALYEYLLAGEITYIASDTGDFIDYIKKVKLLEEAHKRIFEKISVINQVTIDRIEYEREIKIKDDVSGIIREIESIKNKVSETISEDENAKLDYLEKEIEKEYLYAKDIELLKKMITLGNENLKTNYDKKTKVKSISIKMPDKISHGYIPAKKGSIEYHHHLNNNIPRINRLIKNLHKYMKADSMNKAAFKINQSSALQDSINIAVATYDNREFKAISGSNNITNYCKAPSEDEMNFISCKVNKLGELGIGYNRLYDSEKKIFEEIHKQIEEKTLKNEGELILYSKWEPCLSCYFVISQFCKIHPKIKVQIKYNKKYGEH